MLETDKNQAKSGTNIPTRHLHLTAFKVDFISDVQWL